MGGVGVGGGCAAPGVVREVSPAGIGKLAGSGVAAELGARALRRHLDAAVLEPAARLLAKAGAEVSEVREAEIVIAGIRLPQTG